MTFALILAAVFAVLALLLVFAWPLAWALPGERMKRFSQPDMQFMGACTATLCATVVTAPMVAAALISGGESVHTVAAYLFAIEFSL